MIPPSSVLSVQQLTLYHQASTNLTSTYGILEIQRSATQHVYAHRRSSVRVMLLLLLRGNIQSARDAGGDGACVRGERGALGGDGTAQDGAGMRGAAKQCHGELSCGEEGEAVQRKRSSTDGEDASGFVPAASCEATVADGEGAVALQKRWAVNKAAQPTSLQMLHAPRLPARTAAVHVAVPVILSGERAGAGGEAMVRCTMQ